VTATHGAPARASVNLNGRRISYLEWGSAANPTFVLLHGGNSAAADWQDVAAAFADRFRILAPDLRGRGFSDWDSGQDYTVAATVDDVEAWRAEPGLERFVLAGHSFGAVVGLVYAARYPVHVQRLVLLDGGPVPDRSPEDRARRGPTIVDIPLEFATWDAALEWQRARNPKIADELRQRLAENHFVRQPNGRVTWRLDLAGQVKWSRAGDPLMLDQWPFVEALQCPTLVVRGGASPLFGTAIVERMLKTSPHVTAVEIPGAGHSVQHEKPAEVIEAMRRFLRV
jgi:pimeloyl-ACP methyl ester carboxylesterase